jgi:hypothetical protein
MRDIASSTSSPGTVRRYGPTLNAATTKSEHFNRYAQWVSFGGGGLATAAARDEQRKMIKYNHLVANLLIFHTIVGMTKALDTLAATQPPDTVSPEALAGLSPYHTEHINRFGNYVLDLSRPPAPLPFAIPAGNQASNPPRPP